MAPARPSLVAGHYFEGPHVGASLYGAKYHHPHRYRHQAFSTVPRFRRVPQNTFELLLPALTVLKYYFNGALAPPPAHPAPFTAGAEGRGGVRRGSVRCDGAALVIHLRFCPVRTESGASDGLFPAPGARFFCRPPTSHGCYLLDSDRILPPPCSRWKSASRSLFVLSLLLLPLLYLPRLPLSCSLLFLLPSLLLLLLPFRLMLRTRGLPAMPPRLCSGWLSHTCPPPQS